jgi:hypothetical protein
MEIIQDRWPEVKKLASKFGCNYSVDQSCCVIRLIRQGTGAS